MRMCFETIDIAEQLTVKAITIINTGLKAAPRKSSAASASTRKLSSNSGTDDIFLDMSQTQTPIGRTDSDRMILEGHSLVIILIFAFEDAPTGFRIGQTSKGLLFVCNVPACLLGVMCQRG